MNPKNHPVALKLTGLAAALAVASLLGGCNGSPPWGGWSSAPSANQIQTALGRPETFIYFTQYEVYRGDYTHEYVYQHKGKWVRRSNPPKNVAEDTLYLSPTVKLQLPDAPEHQHQSVAQNYPRDGKTASTTMASMP